MSIRDFFKRKQKQDTEEENPFQNGAQYGMNPKKYTPCRYPEPNPDYKGYPGGIIAEYENGTRMMYIIDEYVN